jgi:excisionase family DNA binding protein
MVTPAPEVNGRVLLRVTEAADALGLGRSTVYGLVAAEAIRAIKVGAATRIPVS